MDMFCFKTVLVVVLGSDEGECSKGEGSCVDFGGGGLFNEFLLAKSLQAEILRPAGFVLVGRAHFGLLFVLDQVTGVGNVECDHCLVDNCLVC